MMARTIPVAGEPFLGDDPAVLKVLKITFGGDAAHDALIDQADSTAGALAVDLVNLPYGIHVVDVGWRVITAFNAGQDILLGVDCGSDCNWFANDTDIACTTANKKLKTTSAQMLQGIADSKAVGAAFVPVVGFAGFTPDSDGNNLQAFCHHADTVLDSGVLEVYVYYSGAVSS